MDIHNKIDDVIASHNARLGERHDAEYDFLATKLQSMGVNPDALRKAVGALVLALPSWGVGTGGTRFARFPGEGEPRNVHEKLDDCAVINQLCRLTQSVSLHFPWDWTDDPEGLRKYAGVHGLRFGPVNSNTFQDQQGQAHSYKFGSLSHTSKDVRDQAIEHNKAVADLGQALGAEALTVWVADGSNFPGQQDFYSAFDRYINSVKEVYAHIDDNWTLLIEHKMFEPAFYSSVIQDWGSSLLAATAVGERAKCLIDLGHHAPNTNIEMIVARLDKAERLGGFHFNDSKYGDDDLDSGSINPYQLFLVFNELVEASLRNDDRDFEYMMDQSHNVTDAIESLVNSASSIALAYAQALAVNRNELREAQDDNDPLRAQSVLKAAYETDLRPLVRQVRKELGGAIDPIACYREVGYRSHVAKSRPATSATGSGIV